MLRDIPNEFMIIFFPLIIIGLIKGFMAEKIVNPKRTIAGSFDPMFYQIKYYKPLVFVAIPVIVILEILIRLGV